MEVRKSKITHTHKYKQQVCLRRTIFSSKWHADFLSEYYIFVLPEVYHQINDNGNLLIPVFHEAWEQISLSFFFF